MAQRKGCERVLGPYPHRGGQWRIIVVGAGGERTRRHYESEEEAKKVVRAIRREIERTSAITIREAKDAYELFMRDDKGNKLPTVRDTMWRLDMFFPSNLDEDALSGLTAEKGSIRYEALRTRPSRRGRPLSVDSHRAILAAAKTFLKWCVVEKKWIARNPLDGVKGMGKRRHGKTQLRIDEARKWLVKAAELAERGQAGAVAAMVALLMGMRASEITSRVARDLDDGGRLLWIPNSKTEAGRRTLQVPELLQPYLRRLTERKGPHDLLFGAHWRDWPREWVQRICRAAGVPKVSAHGMRGLHSTLAVDSGVTAHAVAAALGHESVTTTLESYVNPEAASNARQRRVVSLLSERLS